jgi:ABC-type nitrate/sulfonate/bicarbonate transport system permease component
MTRRSRAGWRGWLLPILLVLAAEAMLRTHGVDSPALALPSQVWNAFWRMLNDGSLVRTSAPTVGSAATGWALGGLLGLAMGVLLGLWCHVPRGLWLSVAFLGAIPVVALVPVAMLLTGFGPRMETAVVAVACLAPMLMRSMAAMASVDPRLLQMSRALGLSRTQRLFKIIVPAALPGIGRALSASAVIALAAAVTVEVAANPQGLGYAVIVAQQTLRPEVMLAWLAWMTFLGWVAFAGLRLLQRYAFGLYSAAQVRMSA